MSIEKDEAAQQPAEAVSDIAKQALEDLNKAGFEIESKPTNVEVKETPAKESDEDKPDTDEEKEDDQPAPKADKDKEGEEKPEVKPKVDRKPSIMPAWKHKVAEANWEKEKSDLLARIENLEKASKPGETKKDAETIAEEKEEIADEYKALEDKYGVDSTFVKEFEAIVKKRLGIDPELLSEVKNIKTERDALFQQKQYDAEFSSDVEPLIRQQFPDITADGLAKVKEELQNLAFTEEYAKVPLKKVFKAEIDSIKIPEAPKRQTAEAARPGASRSDVTIDFDNMTEEEFRNLPPEKAMEFASHMAKKSGKKWQTR